MEAAVIQLVSQRAKHHCEYCRLSQQYDAAPFQIEHIIARKHGGSDDDRNLALACIACNNHKGPNIAGLDPQTGQLTRLFHPRTDLWVDHFTWTGPVLRGLSAVGRTTVVVLSINLPYRVELRYSLLAEGASFAPPTSAS